MLKPLSMKVYSSQNFEFRFKTLQLLYYPLYANEFAVDTRSVNENRLFHRNCLCQHV